jgi:DNA-binding transcriptional regulator YiaG
MKKKYYSEASMAIHESAKDLYEAGAITDARMREYDEMCLTSEPAQIPEPAARQNKPVTPAYAGPRTATNR